MKLNKKIFTKEFFKNYYIHISEADKNTIINTAQQNELIINKISNEFRLITEIKNFINTKIEHF